ncbi:MAG: haloalkane dehalogenase [Myxococcota bacterium]
MRNARVAVFVLIIATAAGCSDDAATTDSGEAPLTCDAEPVVTTTPAGVDFVRTPDSCFDDIDDFPYEPKYVEIDGLRQAYFDEGPADADPVLLLHGQPSWSYLYRKMIPVLVDGGQRVIAMDHLGMGRSDKPTDITDYSYLGHIDRLERFIEALGLRHITAFVQDWGSLIGLHVVGDNPDWFARVVVGDGALPVVPESVGNIAPPVENPNEVIEDLAFPFGTIPPQQFPFYDDDCNLISDPEGDAGGFGAWMEYALKAATFNPAEVLEALTWFDIPDSAEAAYDAPYPSRIYLAGPRVFPSLINELPGANEEAWAGLTSYEKPFLTIWASNDPGGLGACGAQDTLIENIPGAAGQPHTRLPEASHFLQDDQGGEIARRMLEFIEATPR